MKTRKSLKPKSTSPSTESAVAKSKSNPELPAAVADTLLSSLKRLASKRVLDDMGNRYGIHTKKAFGVGMAAMQKVAKSAKTKDSTRNHQIAAALWKTDWYEARMVACMIDEPALVTSAQMDAWCRDFDNWGICDTVCFKLFDQVDSALAFRKVKQWASHKDEFIRRAGFALLACLALHRKELDDEPFARCLPLIEGAAGDDRNFVKKGVSWALRSMGRRGSALRSAAREMADQLAGSAPPAARWIGKDALRDLSKGPARR